MLATSLTWSANPDQTKLIVAGHIDNIERFTSYECLYKYGKGEANSLLDARNLDFHNMGYSHRRLLVSGDKTLYEDWAEVNILAKPIIYQKAGQKMGKIMSTGAGRRQLGDDRFQVSYAPQLQTASIDRLDRVTPERISKTPFGFFLFGHKGNRTMFDEWFGQSEKYSYRYAGVIEIDTKPYVAVTVENSKKSSFKELCFDQTMGFMLKRVRGRYENGIQFETLIHSVLDVGDGRFFPEHVVIARYTDEFRSLSVEEIKVTKLDVKSKFPDSEFTFTVPAGTNIQEGGNGIVGRYFKTKQEDTINLDQVDNILKLIEERSKERGDTALPQRSRYRIWSWIGGAGLLLALVGFWQWFRHRRAV